MREDELKTITAEIQALLNAINASTYRPHQTKCFKEIRLTAAKAERGTK